MEDLIISPRELGLGPKFDKWRTTQTEFISNSIDCPMRYIGHDVPTGGGKSPAYVGTIQLTGERGIILTSSKGLQDQLLGDFSDMGMVDIRGKSNYPCNLGAEMTCEDGLDARCPYARNREGGNCPWRTAVDKAKNARLVVSNYPCWILNNMWGEGWGRFGVMVCDEAHSAHNEVCEAINVEFLNYEIYGLLRRRFPQRTGELAAWQEWSAELLPIAEGTRDLIQAEILQMGGPNAPRALIARLRHYRNLARKFSSVVSAVGQWVPSETKEGWKLDPIWATDYADSVLFCNVPKVILTSATLTEKTLGLLGIVDDYWFIEYPSSFPPENSPVIWVPTSRMSHRSDTYDLQKMIMTVDDLVQDRLDRKGTCHTVSYDRRDMLVENSRHADIMVTHERGNSRDTVTKVELFKRSMPPSVLVSPSITTGYDFPGEECEYQLIIKIPFPDRHSNPVMEARCKADKQYGPYLTAQTLVQMCGRGMRGEKDLCQNLVTDNMINVVMNSEEYRGLLPVWFRRLYKRHRDATLPRPLPKIQSKP